MIVFSFVHQPTDAVFLVPLLQKRCERPMECGLPPLDHAAILLHGDVYKRQDLGIGGMTATFACFDVQRLNSAREPRLSLVSVTLDPGDDSIACLLYTSRCV